MDKQSRNQRNQRVHSGLRSTPNTLVALAILVIPLFASERSTVKMDVYDLSSDNLMYTAVRTLDQQENNIMQVTIYYSLDGIKIQEDSVAYDPATLTLTYSRSEDLRSGKVEQMELVDGDVEVLFLEKRGAQPEKALVPWTEATTFNAALIPLIRRNWQLLQGREELGIELLLPNHQEALAMRLKKDKEIIINGRSATVISLGPRIWFFRKIIGPISYIITNDHSHQLLEFRGLTSQLADDSGKVGKLRIVYNYAAK